MHTSEELKKLARTTSNARLRIRLMAISLFVQGASRTQIAKNIGVARGSVNDWVKRYLNGGLEALTDKPSPGRPSALSSSQRRQLKKYVEAHAIKTDGGRLIAKDIQQYIRTTFDVSFQLGNVYRLLHQLGFSWITSRSKHPKQSQEAQDAFKKLPSGNDPSHPGSPSAGSH